MLGRRTIPKGAEEPAELAYYVCAGLADTSLEQLITVAGGRWRIEECFQAAKNEASLASYQVRDYTAWYRHITLAMLAHAYLSATRASAEKGVCGRNRAAHRADRARAPAPADHPHPQTAARSGVDVGQGSGMTAAPMMEARTSVV